ncbi:GFA family protein [Hoeflea sp. AS16]|uniref:GFA family protein n=1 Tax=Hoeflea sp. AS16 TaxID=3135779 RepID=UPI0031707229
MSIDTHSGGCQCGAVRYRFSTLGKASICHCRMCQKAFGNYFAPLVEVEGFEWTRGARAVFASSNLSNRGFCRDCGSPLTLETDDVFEVAVGSLDDPSVVYIAYHANIADRHEVIMRLDAIPDASPDREAENNQWNARIVSHQHPDHDTKTWPERKA